MKIVILMCLLSASAIYGKPLTYSSDLQNASDLVAQEIHLDKPVNQPENTVADDHQQQTDEVEPELLEENPEEPTNGAESDESEESDESDESEEVESDESDESEEKDDEDEIREEPPRRVGHDLRGNEEQQARQHEHFQQPSHDSDNTNHRQEREHQIPAQDRRGESDQLQPAQEDRERHGQRSQQQAQTKVSPEQGHFQVPDLSKGARDTSDQTDREGVHLANLNIVINV